MNVKGRLWLSRGVCPLPKRPWTWTCGERWCNFWHQRSDHCHPRRPVGQGLIRRNMVSHPKQLHTLWSLIQTQIDCGNNGRKRWLSPRIYRQWVLTRGTRIVRDSKYLYDMVADHATVDGAFCRPECCGFIDEYWSLWIIGFIRWRLHRNRWEWRNWSVSPICLAWTTTSTS